MQPVLSNTPQDLIWKDHTTIDGDLCLLERVSIFDWGHREVIHNLLLVKVPLLWNPQRKWGWRTLAGKTGRAAWNVVTRHLMGNMND